MRKRNRPIFEAVRAELLRSAGRWFEGPSGTTVDVAPGPVRAGSSSYLCEFALSRGDLRRTVLVKVAKTGPGNEEGAAPEPADDRPRIGLWCEPHRLVEYEQRTLRCIDERFREIGDPRFGTVRVLDILLDGRATVMEKLAHPTLRSLFVAEGWSRQRCPSTRIEATLRNTGAWLRAFHDIPALEHTRPRRTTRSEFLESLDEFAGYLERAGENGRYLNKVVSTAERAARGTLPEELPARFAHGDFAPRNVLVDPGERIYVIDTSGRWIYPVLQDIAYFLTGLKTVGPQVATRGALIPSRKMQACEDAFLHGYFDGATVPVASIRLFEIQTLLSRWVSVAYRLDRAEGGRRAVQRLALVVRGRFYRRHLRSILRSSRWSTT